MNNNQSTLIEELKKAYTSLLVDLSETKTELATVRKEPLSLECENCVLKDKLDDTISTNHKIYETNAVIRWTLSNKSYETDTHIKWLIMCKKFDISEAEVFRLRKELEELKAERSSLAPARQNAEYYQAKRGRQLHEEDFDKEVHSVLLQSPPHSKDTFEHLVTLFSNQYGGSAGLAMKYWPEFQALGEHGDIVSFVRNLFQSDEPVEGVSQDTGKSQTFHVVNQPDQPEQDMVLLLPDSPEKQDYHSRATRVIGKVIFNAGDIT